MTPCPTPNKNSYSTHHYAKRARWKGSSVYLCRCGNYHLTSKTKRSPERSVTA